MPRGPAAALAAAVALAVQALAVREKASKDAFHTFRERPPGIAGENDSLRSLRPPTAHAKICRAKAPLPNETVTCADVQGSRVVSVADLHGDFVGMLQLLQGLGLVRRGVSEDPGTWQSMWAGGDAIFLQLGDVVDRGHEGQRMWKFLWALQDERPANVVLLLGNHETWLFTLGYMGHPSGPSRQDRCSYTLDPDECLKPGRAQCVDPPSTPALSLECFRRAWSGAGFMGGQVLKRLKMGLMKMVHQVGGTVFVHAGVTPRALDLLAESLAAKPSALHGGQYIEAMNERALWAMSSKNRKDFVIDEDSIDGPAWTRMFSNEDTCEVVESVLQRLGARRMVKGHDYQTDGEAKPFCQGKLLLTDTYMSEGYTKDRETSEHNLMALETATDGLDVQFVYPMRQEGKRCRAVS